MLEANSRYRGTIVAAMFCAFPIGYMVFSLLTLFTKDVSILTSICLISNLAASLLPCLFFQESPMYLIEKKVSFSRVLHVLNRIRAMNGRTLNNGLLTLLKANLQARTATDAIEGHNPLVPKVVEVPKEWKEKSIVGRFFCTWVYLYQFIILSLIGGFINCVYFAITLKISKLTSASVTVNGLIFALISLASTLLILPFGATLPRRLSLWLGQLVILAGCLVLFVFDWFDYKTGTLCEVLQGIITTVFIGGVMYTLFTPYFYYVTELFPVELRGTANALVNFCSLLLSMTAPFLYKFADDRRYNGIEATCIFGLVSLPLTFFLRETVVG